MQELLLTTFQVNCIINSLLCVTVYIALDNILLKIPTKKDAMNRLVCIEDKWHEIGDALEVTRSKLNILYSL